MKFVDVKNDVAFRKIFGNQYRTEVLISFINAVLCLELENKIIEVTILTPYQLPELRGGKVTIIDVKAKDKSGKTYIIEMQIAMMDGFHKRVLYYASKSYSSQISRGDDYTNLMPTFFIGILDFVATENKNFINRHIVKDSETGEHFIQDISFNFIELPKFNKQSNELKSIIDQWVYFIKNVENLDVIPENIIDKGLKFAYEDADKHNWTPEELEAYDKVFIREQDDRGRISFALKKAVSERDLEFAIKLLKRGRPILEIAEDTGLTIEQIENLKIKHKT
ncbi:MAG: Rpn family recombination-promoting nuclease/putative transposase [Bacteroidetes bacterium]|nr:MAG: Rpn family recombination-promoting nuclease/putative transposase [Bacteroidota bacterium]